MTEQPYFVYIIQNNVRHDGCDYSIDDSLPTCGKQVVVAIYRVTKPQYGGSAVNLSPKTLSQLDVAVSIVKQIPGAAYVGTPEEERLFEFALHQLVNIRPKIHLSCMNRGE